MHAMICTDCLSGVLQLLNLTDLSERLRRPLFFIKESGGIEGPPPPGRNDIFERSEEQYKKFKEDMGRRDQRRRKLSLESVRVSVVNGDHREFSLDKPSKLRIPLRVGEQFIKIEAVDEEGPLTLEMRYVPWDKAELDSPIEFTTKLKGRRKITFSVAYSSNESGELTGALLNVEYCPPVPLYVQIGVLVGATLGASVALSKLMAPAKRLFSRAKLQTAEKPSLRINLLVVLLIACAAMLLVSRSTVVAFLARQLPGFNSPNVSEPETEMSSSNPARTSANTKGSSLGLWYVMVDESGSTSAVNNRAYLRDAKLVISNVHSNASYSIFVSDKGTIHLPQLDPGVYRFALENGRAEYIETVRFPLERNSINLPETPEVSGVTPSKRVSSKTRKRGHSSKWRIPKTQVVLVRKIEHPN